MVKVLLVFGTRPEAIKMCPLALELRKSPNIEVYVCVSGQHVELLDDVCDIFGVIPDKKISSMSPGQSLCALFSTITSELDSYVKEISPDLVLVHGDTTTTAAAALCAFYNKVKLAHVEAGLRTFDLQFPWPEEGNRKIVSAISSIHFAPTQKSYDNLIAEGIKKETIYVTGNTVIDALYYAKTKVRERDCSVISSNNPKKCNLERRSILITCHRTENHGDGVRNLCNAIVELLTLYDDLQFVIPLHPNPAVKDVFIERLSKFDSVSLLGSQDYLSFVQLMDNSHLILTDSGGIQEEAPSLGIPVLVLRDVSERPEAVEAGTVKLIGNNCANIVSRVSEVLNEENHLRSHIKDNPYGDGTACKQMRQILEEYFK